MNKQDERLRDQLRGADPAAGEPGLPPEEVQAMRRTVLTAVAEPRRRWIPIAALAGSALAALSLAVMLLRPVPEEPSTPPRPPQRVAAEPVPIQPPAPEIVPEKPEGPPVTRKPRRKPEPAAVAIAEAAPEVAPELPVEPEPVATIAAETRQIQFSTPGGTRIIWVLTSDGTSH